MRQVFEEFLESESGYSKSTLQNRKSGLRKFGQWLDETDRTVDDCGGRELRTWFGWMETKTVEDENGNEKVVEWHPDLTRSNYLTHIRQFYDWYYLDDDNIENPADKVKTTQLNYETKHDKPTLNSQEVRMLIGSAQSKRAEALLSLMASTGCRVGEAVQIRMDQLDLEDRRIDDLPTIKTDVDPRTVWFDRSARTSLKQYINGGYRDQYAGDSDYVFKSYGERGEHMSTDRARVDFLTAVENCNSIQDKVEYETMADGRERCNITTHILRRSFCQAWVDNGGDIMSLKNQVGWKNLETAKQYLDDEVSKDERDRYGPSF